MVGSAVTVAAGLRVLASLDLAEALGLLAQELAAGVATGSLVLGVQPVEAMAGGGLEANKELLLIGEHKIPTTRKWCKLKHKCTQPTLHKWQDRPSSPLKRLAFIRALWMTWKKFNRVATKLGWLIKWPIPVWVASVDPVLRPVESELIQPVPVVWQATIHRS